MSSDSSAKGPRRDIRIGKYQVLAHIATGGMGAVYKARDTDSGREVALKVLQPEVAGKPALIARFRREADHALRLRHENIVTVYEFGEANKTLFLAMEFIDGIDLHEYSQRKGPLDPEEARQIVLQAARGLQHAFEQGIVHRDVKPSNFLVTRHNGKLVVKLTDLGLAREQDGQEGRITRAGTTVGTLDYMSPEQARDSGKADVRSDLYSLGGTWYHLLAGQAPFPKGGLAERLLKIMNSPPGDVRVYNPRVSAATWAVVRRLLEKDPDDRYQTPAELIEDLEALGGGPEFLSRREELAATVHDEPAPPVKERCSKTGRPSSKSRPAARTSSSSSKSDTAVDRPTRTPRPLSKRRAPVLWYALGGATTLALVLGLVLVIALRGRKPSDTGTTSPDSYTAAPMQTGSAITPTPEPQPPDDPGNKPPTTSVTPPGTQDPSRPEWPALYKPAAPIPVAELRKEFEHLPTDSKLLKGAPQVLAVSRSPLLSGGPSFLTLQDAIAATKPNRPYTIELHDNGPLMETPVTLTDRHVVIRPARGFRPLLCWDVGRPPAERPGTEPGTPRRPLVFFDVRGGSLTVEDVSLAVRWPQTSSEGAALLNMQDAQLALRRCILSVAGKPRDGLTVVRFKASGDLPPGCGLSHCFVRGTGLTLLDLDAPGATVHFDHSLFVTGDRPCLQVRAGSERPPSLRAARSTFLAGSPFLSVQPARPEVRFPRLSWLGWDVLISHPNSEVRGELLQVQGGAGTDKMSWRAFNCLYAGWGVLQSGSSTIAADDVTAWRRQWERIEGDVAQPEPWPTKSPSEPAESRPSAFQTAHTAVAFAASADPNGPLGCDLEQMPPARDSWLPLTFDRYAAIPPPPLEDNGPPDIDPAQDGLYHGEEVDLDRRDRRDLGGYLDQVQSSGRRLAPRVVLHLSGKGEHTTSAIRFQGKQLVLYFKPPAEKTDKPLSLRFKERGLRKAAIELSQGSLDVIGGTLHLSESAPGEAPPWLIEASGGVRLLRCRLEGPQQHPPDAYRGLVLLTGSGDASGGNANSCSAEECVLVSGKAGIVAQGLGARIFLRQTVLVAGGNALELTPGAAFADKANVQVQLERSTLAAREAVVRLADIPKSLFPSEPVIVQSRTSAFLNPFVGRGDRPGLLRYDNQALAHGLIAWQSDGDFYDRRLAYMALSTAGKLPDRPEPFAAWLAAWGTAGVTHPLTDVRIVQGFPTERWPLDLLLTFQRSLGGRGADVSQLPGFRKAGPR
jgi:serine/threonine-protein kinase